MHDRNKIKRFLACLLCFAIMLPISFSVYSDDEPEEEQAVEEEAEEEEEEKDSGRKKKWITDEEAMKSMALVCENDTLALYKSTKRGSTEIGLMNKASGKMWWSNPINATNTKAKPAQKKELQSGMSLIYAEPEPRKTSTVQSKGGAEVEMTDTANGVDITYTFGECGITVICKRIHCFFRKEF